MPLLKTLSGFVKRSDIYGTQVSFHYNNSATVKSFVEGFFTLASRLGILAFFFVMLNNVINKDKTVSFKSVNKSLLKDKTIYNLTLDSFDIGFGIEWFDGLLHQEERENLHKYLTFRFISYEALFETLADG